MNKPEEIDENGCGGAGGSTAGAVGGGYQVPMGIKKRKKNVDEAIKLNGLSEGLVLTYVNGMTEELAEQVGSWLDEGNYVQFAEGTRRS
jgi:hypothetical protein